MALRATQGLTQLNIAKMMGCHLDFIIKLEEGKDGDMRVSDLKKYCECFGCQDITFGAGIILIINLIK